MMIEDGDYLLETKYACAWIKIRDDIVIDAAPIYRWMKSQRFKAEKLKSDKRYKLTKLHIGEHNVREE